MSKFYNLTMIDNDILKIFALNLKLERIKQGLKQSELAEKANMDASYISNIECAKQNISLTKAEQLARALNVPLSKLIEQS